MRILIVEDEVKIANFLKKSLESEYFVVDLAADGERGAELGRLNEYDLIVLDYMLPKKNGIEVCQEIRQKGKTTPIIILSVKNETADKVSLLNAGADDYLTKPFSFEELLARVHALLRRPASVVEEVLTEGDVVIDIKRHQVTKANKIVALTKKEYILLEYLMRNKGRVMSRGMILEHVWDMDTDPFSNTIESHILSLRRKLSDKDCKFIKTVMGSGYIIDKAEYVNDHL